MRQKSMTRREIHQAGWQNGTPEVKHGESGMCLRHLYTRLQFWPPFYTKNIVQKVDVTLQIQTKAAPVKC